MRWSRLWPFWFAFVLVGALLAALASCLDGGM
jgi:hypothetical protein